MTNKKTFPTELAYVFGLVILTLGVALTKQADFGLSMVVAPAYLLSCALQPILPFFTFGTAEYTLQAILLVGMMIAIRRFRVSYLFSFVTAFVYGLLLDVLLIPVGLLPVGSVWLRLVWFLAGQVCTAAGVAFFFHTYIAPEVYELVVMEFSKRWHWQLHRCKIVYDCISCAVAVVMSFAIFGLWHLEGVGLGTIYIALTNGFLIGRISKFLDARFSFRDALPLRRFFE